MAFPFMPLIVGGVAANLYSQAQQRKLYRYQRAGYERQYRDWKNNVGRSREIRYPELSYPGRIRALDTGIRQSYASSLGTLSGFGSAYGYNRIRNRRVYNGSLYFEHTGYASRWL